MASKSIALRATAKHPTKPEGTTYLSFGPYALADVNRGYAVARKSGDIEEVAPALPPDPEPTIRQEKPRKTRIQAKPATKGRYNRRDLRSR